MRRLATILLAGAAAAALGFLNHLRGSARSPSMPAPEDTQPVSAPSDATRAELYEEAKRLDIQGRSKMDKAELRRAIEGARAK